MTAGTNPVPTPPPLSLHIGDVVRRMGPTWGGIRHGEVGYVTDQRQNTLTGELEIRVHLGGTDWYVVDGFELINRGAAQGVPAPDWGAIRPEQVVRFEEPVVPWPTTTTTATTWTTQTTINAGINAVPVPNPLTLPRRFEVGDRVRIINNLSQADGNTIGHEGTVEVIGEEEGRTKYYLNTPSGNWFYFESDLAPTNQLSRHEFQVGDEVRIMRNTANGPRSEQGRAHVIREVRRPEYDEANTKYFFYVTDLDNRWYQYETDLELVKAGPRKQDPKCLKSFSTFIKSKTSVA